MTVGSPEQWADLLAREKKSLAHLALVLKDGTPQVTPMWFDFDGTHFIFNTARGRVKDRIMQRHPAVAFAISDPANAYRYVQVRGQVVTETETGGYDQICALSEALSGTHVGPVTVAPATNRRVWTASGGVPEGTPLGKRSMSAR